MVSPSLRQMVTQHLFLKAISNNKVFKDHPQVIEYLVLNIEAN